MKSSRRFLLNVANIRSARSQSSWSQERRCLPVISQVMTERVKDATLLPWCDVIIPPVSYCDYVWDNVRHHGHLPALHCPVQGTTLSHGQVRETALEVARALTSLGLKKGEVVAVILPNCVEYPPLVLACLYLGLPLTPINPSYTAHEISRQLSSSSARLVFSHSSLTEKTLKVLELSPLLQSAVMVGQQKTSPDLGLSWTDFLAVSSGAFPPQADINLKTDVAILPYSSGTTGRIIS